ncbi:TPA: DUF2971 domain-containing protein [Pseudomonas aeruginosa]|uniref:DUF2971 domain-containing protein n=1 Tax=Pseudomonas aeruginosa TaxID=287 RepID=UPI00287FC9D3|nr:DUF2971 domain-containing protein [Pseudomonas aeruginosa]HBP0149879.1 DUF2971 domain-containing protein [Pseudomonas aeruginosa]HEP9854722.1 DUF2971 domain-containing protein [Pseudomonas aeruginosa]HEP9989144.1 DUF2971 domain-containing protein [Pseudomonas aeruginosa]
MPANRNLREKWTNAGYKPDMGSAVASLPPTNHEMIRLYNLNKAEHALSNLENSRIKISTFNDLNDPFELLAANFKESISRKIFRDWKSTTNEKTGIICFSGDWSEPVMWSHYADKHKGICLGFNVNKKIVQKINYQPDRLMIELKSDTNPEHLPNELKDSLLCTKSSGWSYEEEYRTFLELKPELKTEDLYFRELDEDIELAEVILGPLCDKPISTIRSLVASKYPKAVVFQARLAFQSFKVVPDERTVRWIPD